MSMDDNLDRERLLAFEHQKTAEHIAKWYKVMPHQDLEAIIEEVKVLQKFNFTSNKVYLIWAHDTFTPVYISDSVNRIMGYKPDYFYNLTLIQLLKFLYWQQLPWVYKIHKYGEHFWKLTGSDSMKKTDVFIFGVKVKDRWGKVKIFFGRQKNLSVGRNGEVLLSFLEVEDISTISKGDVGWFRRTHHSSSAITTQRVYYFSKSKKQIATELLSDREIQVLKLIKAKKDSAAIANQLDISLETVKKHRKNMIARVGIKDMTALIYICQQMNII